MKFRAVLEELLAHCGHLLLILRIGIVLLTIQLLSDEGGILYDVLPQVLVRLLDVLLPDLLDLRPYSIFKLTVARSCLSAEGFLAVGLQCPFLSLTNAAVEVFLGLGQVTQIVLERPDENLIAFVHGPPALLLAHVIPGIFDIGDSAFIDGSHVGIHHGAVEGAVEFLVLQGLGLDRRNNPLSEVHGLLHELRTQLVVVHLVQILKLHLIDEGTDHRKAVSVLEKGS